MAHFGYVYLTINQIANYEGIVNKYEHPPNTVTIYIEQIFQGEKLQTIPCTRMFYSVDDDDDDDGIETMHLNTRSNNHHLSVHTIRH